MIIIFKGKGILVPVLLIVSWIVVMAVGVLFEYYSGIIVKGPLSIIWISFSAMLGGILIRFVGKDFIKKGEKRVEIDLDNRFFFIKMKNVGTAFIFLGVVVFGYGIYVTFISVYFS
jgi:hypothetical protein